MASHVVVLDSSARRTVIKTSPAKHLADVLHEACTKFGLDVSQHGLRNNINNKILDLSQPIRLSGLLSGAKLQIVVLSRSPSVVSVALQLTDSESGTSDRLTGRFPTTTTIWLLLRYFESGSMSSKPSRNFTARSISQLDTDGSVSGRSFYETPVIQFMGRELSSFTDLQKSFAQLGFNGGSVLLRLSFRRTECPFEAAIAEIDDYFKSEEDIEIGGTVSANAAIAESAPPASVVSSGLHDEERPLLPEPSSLSQVRSPPQHSAALCTPNSHQSGQTLTRSDSSALLANAQSTPDEKIIRSVQRPLSVFAPSSESTPAASRQVFNEKDYELTIAHAKLHQARLATSGVNRRLPADAELAVQANTQAKKSADVKEVQIKIRFPDQMQVLSTFSNLDSSATLYEFVRGLMEKENEPFSLNFSSAQGPVIVPKKGHMRLIGDLGMAGRVLVNVAWENGVSSRARGGNVLKAELQKQAMQIEVKETESVQEDENVGETFERKGNQRDEGRERTGGVPRWLKLPGKK